MTYKYNAFISYRQVSVDKIVANRLHQELEKYKIPKALVEEGFPSKLSKVFKDVDELSANPNLSEAIYEALRESEFLIVVCSPRTHESKWISEEIDTFIKLGRTDKILTLIIEGEIEESIPSLLRGETLPLAADIRDSHDLPSLKKISLAKLKLIAPIIGCDYDDLFQRDEKRKREFIMTVTVTFSVVMLILAIIFGKLSYQLENSNQSLQKSNTELNLTNQKLNQAIFETSAIYAQFFLTAQDDYTKWSKATTKIIDTLNHKDVDKAIKINELLAKYISIKGYELEKDMNILPFYETPQYFLKTLFFKNAKYTTGYIEDRYLSLLLLDDIEFPAKLFLFLSNPSIKLPQIYQRMRDAVSTDLERYGYFLEAMNHESKNRHKEALESLGEASEKGFFHSLTSNMTMFYLDDNHLFLHELDDKNFVKDVNATNRLMTQKEKQNLIRHINIYYLLSISYATQKQPYLQVDYSSDDAVILWQKIQEEEYGRITYRDIANYITSKLKVGKNKELSDLVYTLQHPLISKEELEKREEYQQNQKRLADSFKTEIVEAFKSESHNQPKVDKLLEKITKADSQKLTKRFLEYSSYQTRDIREIDELFSALKPSSIETIRHDLHIPSEIISPKEMRIYIAKQIRAYNFDLTMYNRFVSDERVFQNLSIIYTNEPNNNHIKFALRCYWQLKGDKKKADFYWSTELDQSYFKEIDQIFKRDRLALSNL